jgi:hypothetical protein
MMAMHIRHGDDQPGAVNPKKLLADPAVVLILNNGVMLLGNMEIAR